MRILRDREVALLARLRDRLLALSAESTLVCLRNLVAFVSELGPPELLLNLEGDRSTEFELRRSRDLLRVSEGDRDLLLDLERPSGFRERDLSRSLEFLRSKFRALDPDNVSERDGNIGFIFSGERSRGRSKPTSSLSMLNCRVAGCGRFIDCCFCVSDHR